MSAPTTQPAASTTTTAKPAPGKLATNLFEQNIQAVKQEQTMLQRKPTMPKTQPNTAKPLNT